MTELKGGRIDLPDVAPEIVPPYTLDMLKQACVEDVYEMVRDGSGLEDAINETVMARMPDPDVAFAVLWEADRDRRGDGFLYRPLSDTRGAANVSEALMGVMEYILREHLDNHDFEGED